MNQELTEQGIDALELRQTARRISGTHRFALSYRR